ncbi:hypothetical protein C5S42_02425 [Candidatus Methanomarinus sp.]|nr:hypothetical protein C5S42_02425 [ANME-2 cluster archaeon]
MEFINRHNELEFLQETKELSCRKLFTISIYGLRRIGKTRLILHFLQKNDLYFFVNKDKTSDSLLIEYQDIIRSKNILGEFESLKTWDEYFRVLFERFEGVIAFDEFQNFIKVDRSVFGILQKNIDIYENRKNILFIFSGSTTGLIKKIFSDLKQPLYGRLKRSIQLEQFNFSIVLKMCEQLDINNMSEVITLYSIFGGFPRYYVAIDDENLNGKNVDEILEKFFFMKNSIFEDEVNTILSLEFGRRSGTYYDILTAIANGSTRISEISSFLRKKETSLTRQINELVNYFNLIGIEKSIIGNKSTIYIQHPLMNFWFKFIYKNFSDYEKRSPLLIDKIKKEYKNIGRGFELLCKEFLLEKNRLEELPFKFNDLGRQWGKFKGEKGRNVYEIDLVGLNESTKEILFCECKWKEKVNAMSILHELKKKAEYVQWNNETRKHYYAVFARSFSRRSKEALCYDLKDFETHFKISQRNLTLSQEVPLREEGDE